MTIGIEHPLIRFERKFPIQRSLVRTQQGSVLYVCGKFEADISIRSNVIRGPKISKFGHVTEATPTYGSFYGPHAVGVHPVCANFEADSSIHSKVEGSQNFEIWSRDPGHAYIGVVLWSGRSRGPSSMSVPNLKQISIRSKVIRVPKFRNWVTWP